MVVKRSLRQASGDKQAGPPLDLQQTPHCALCGREVVPGPTADEHHLVPRSKGGRDKTLIHRICHTKIHATLSENELAKHYNTWDALRAHPEIATFIAWLANKPPTFMMRNRQQRKHG